MRKPIQISSCYLSADHQNFVNITALCDDGTIWQIDLDKWEQLPPIPQDETSLTPEEMYNKLTEEDFCNLPTMRATINTLRRFHPTPPGACKNPNCPRAAFDEGLSCGFCEESEIK